MYDELVKRLREPCQYENCILCQQAADAIAELQKRVPKAPHGRLADADEMKKSIRKQTAFLRLIGGEFAEIAEVLEKGFLQEIDNAPTIIPAEPAEEGE